MNHDGFGPAAAQHRPINLQAIFTRYLYVAPGEGPEALEIAPERLGHPHLFQVVECSQFPPGHVEVRTVWLPEPWKVLA
jgi:hypothetical protein